VARPRGSRARGLATAALAAGLVVSSAVVATAPARASAPAASGAGSIAWSECNSATLKFAGAVCGYLTVPLDHAKPSGRKIALALSMVRHTVPDSAYQGVVLVNPGGPGASGIGRSVTGSKVPNGVGAAYDWIGFDPRGVGASVPELSCDPHYFDGPRPAYRTANGSTEKAWLARTKAYAKACGKAAPGLLAHVSTADSARDLDAIRVAMGQERLNYYGYSYGTYLGQVYATMFPDRVRRMVFDGVVDPRGVWYNAQLRQDEAFDVVMKAFFGWIASYDGLYSLGATEAAVEKTFYATQKDLAARPTARIGSSEWNDAFLRAGYREFSWPKLADAFAAWVHRKDMSRVEAQYADQADLGNDNGFAMYNAVQCTDAAWPVDFAKWRADADRTAAATPYATWGNVWFNAPCLYWPAKPGIPVTIDGSRTGSLLLISGTLDAATPFTGALEVRRRFPNARLIAEPGMTTHANSLTGNACVDQRIAAYFATGELPPRQGGDVADVECMPLPRPLPTQLDPVGLSSTSTGALLSGVLPVAP
jgi:pimeloyl-ACP methyl ester carboxylesterase